jgi:hypothetical protein
MGLFSFFSGGEADLEAVATAEEQQLEIRCGRLLVAKSIRRFRGKIRRRAEVGRLQDIEGSISRGWPPPSLQTADQNFEAGVKRMS